MIKQGDKGYTSNWTEQVFVIERAQYTNPTTYKLKDELLWTRTIKGWTRCISYWKGHQARLYWERTSFGEVVDIQRWFQYLGSAEGFKTNITHSMEQDKWNMRQILIGRHHLMNLIGHHHLMNQNRHLLIPIGHNHQTTIGHHMNEVVPIGIRWTRVYIAISFWRNMKFSVLCEIDACWINW